MRTLRAASLAALLALTAAFPFFARAHGTNFLEFAPDISERLVTGGLGTPSQAISPPNDFLGGVDLWIDTPAPATFTVELRSEAGALLVSRSVSVVTTPAVWAGTRTHVDFAAQTPLAPGATYRIAIVGTPSELALYRADRSQILQHNASYLPAALPLPASLGATEQPFAFKHALYERQESAPPTITAASTTILSHASVRVTWHANEPVDGRVTYSPQGQGENQGTAYTGSYAACPPTADPCSVTIPTAPLTAYQFTLHARDEWGNESLVSGAFTTPAGPQPPSTGSPQPSSGQAPSTSSGQTGQASPPLPGAPPVISGASVTAVTVSAVTVHWQTNEAANSLLTVRQGLSTVATVNDPTFELDHTLGTLSVLTPGSTYTAVIRSTDTEELSSSLDLPFTTAAGAPGGATPPPPPPAPGTPPPPGGTAPTPPPQGGTSPAGGTPAPPAGGSPPQGGNITATALAPAGGTGNDGQVRLDWSDLSPRAEEGFRVDILREDGSLAQQYALAAGKTGLTVHGLDPGAYTAIVYGRNGGIYEKIAPPVIFEIRGPSSFSVPARIWFTILMASLILGTGTLILIARRRRATRAPKAPPRRKFLYE